MRSRSSPEALARATRRSGLLVASIGALLLLGTLPTLAQDGSAAPGDLLFIDADTVQGPANLTEEERPLLSCVQDSRFARNEEIVWRVKVIDPLTGQPMDDTGLESVEVVR